MSTNPTPTADDPLAQITMRPRTFVAVLAVAALLVGLLLALIPVRVAAPDPVGSSRVTCGNTIGGVESGALAAWLGSPDQPTLVDYVDICERAVSERQDVSWPMFIAGFLTILWLGVVRTGAAGPSRGTGRQQPGEPTVRLPSNHVERAAVPAPPEQPTRPISPTPGARPVRY